MKFLSSILVSITLLTNIFDVNSIYNISLRLLHHQLFFSSIGELIIIDIL